MERTPAPLFSIGGSAQPSAFCAEREIVAGSGATLADDFGDNRNGDLLGRLGADIKPKRSMDVVKQPAVKSLLLKMAEHRADPPARSDHADEAARLSSWEMSLLP